MVVSCLLLAGIHMIYGINFLSNKRNDINGIWTLFSNLKTCLICYMISCGRSAVLIVIMTRQLKHWFIVLQFYLIFVCLKESNVLKLIILSVQLLNLSSVEQLRAELKRREHLSERNTVEKFRRSKTFLNSSALS